MRDGYQVNEGNKSWSDKNVQEVRFSLSGH